MPKSTKSKAYFLNFNFWKKNITLCGRNKIFNDGPVLFSKKFLSVQLVIPLIFCTLSQNLQHLSKFFLKPLSFSQILDTNYELSNYYFSKNSTTRVLKVKKLWIVHSGKTMIPKNIPKISQPTSRKPEKISSPQKNWPKM